MIIKKDDVKQIIVQAGKFGDYVQLQIEDCKAIVKSIGKKNLYFEAAIEEIENPTEGELYIFDKQALDILQKCPEDIKFNKTKDNKINIKSGKFKVSLSEAEQDIIEIAEPEVKYFFTIEELNKIKNVRYAASSKDTRPALECVYFKVEPELNKIRIVATDSYRIAVDEIDYKCDTKVESVSFLLDKKILGDIISKGDNNSILCVCDNKIIFAFEKGIIIGVDTLAEEYIDIEKMLKSMDFKFQFKINRENLTKSIRRCKIGDKNSIKLSINNNSMNIETNSKKNSIYINDELDIDGNSEGSEIHLSIDYLLDALENMKSEYIIIKYSDNKTFPILLEDNTNKAFILPVNE
ncbi:DNA polymerase III subunit beta [Clostridioides difficile]|uniref:DNA polymerase III subunit beta n=1 Tax=Clostridioides difficile TaxID=1496 RepID=UPI0021C95365|nr:DNA polymerase III subunit beta [Clostridioides difficile]UUV16663.1 DNA polymerase III subunit beta [Clostridioides difficile]